MTGRLNLDLPASFISRVSSESLFDKAYLEVLLLVCSRPAPPERESGLSEDNYGLELRGDLSKI